MGCAHSIRPPPLGASFIVSGVVRGRVMMFIAPLLAGLTALGSIPLIIWLLNRNRFKVIRWPALEFLLKTLQKSSRRLQIRELILLILRTLAVILMALALARPSIAAGGLSLLGMRGGVSAVIVLDRSLSMAARDGTGSRLDSAKSRAQELVSKLPRGSSAALVLMSDNAVAELAEPSQDLAYVAQMIEATQQSDGGTSVVAGISRAMEILRDAGGRREIYLIGDMQERGWPSPDDRAWKALAEELARPDSPALFLADVAGQSRDNVQVESFTADDELVTTDGATPFTAVVRNRGGAPANDVQIELWADGEDGQLRKAAGTVIERLETVSEVRLEARLAPGLRRIQLRLLPDQLPADDARQIVVEAVDKVRVLVIDGAEGVRGGGAEFLKAALAPIQAMSAPAANRPGATPAPAEAQEDAGPADLFKVEVVSPGALSQVDLAAYQAVVLSDPASPPPGLGDALRAWVSAGRGLILLPGGRATAAAWNTVLAPVAPAELVGEPRELVDDKGAKGQGLATTGLIHPVVSFFATPENQPFLAQPRFWRAHGLKPAEGTTVVAKFADGLPALVERTIGRGAVLMSAFPTDKAWSDLPLRPAFLMLTRRMVQHAALGNRPRLNVRVHDPIRLVIPAKLAGTRIESTDPQGGRSVLNPESTPDGSARVELTDTPFAGFYQLKGAERPWWFAANPPAEESDLSALSREEATARLQPAPLRWIGSSEDAGASVDRARSGIEIWWILFALAVGCLIAESILVVKWAPKDA
jgi:hypothetical protein